MRSFVIQKHIHVYNLNKATVRIQEYKVVNVRLTQRWENNVMLLSLHNGWQFDTQFGTHLERVKKTTRASFLFRVIFITPTLM